jgi:tRNA-dihydrouridine synthase
MNRWAVDAILAAVRIPCQLGGGIRDAATLDAWLETGLARIILGTAALKDPVLVREACWHLSVSIRMAILQLQAGRLIAVPTPEKSLSFLETELGSPDAKARNRRLIAGSPATVRAGIEGVAREFGAEEVMIVTITHDHQARRRSFELVAEAFAMTAEGSLAGAAPASR